MRLQRDDFLHRGLDFILEDFVTITVRGSSGTIFYTGGLDFRHSRRFCNIFVTNIIV